MATRRRAGGAGGRGGRSVEHAGRPRPGTEIESGQNIKEKGGPEIRLCISPSTPWNEAQGEIKGNAAPTNFLQKMLELNYV